MPAAGPAASPPASPPGWVHWRGRSRPPDCRAAGTRWEPDAGERRGGWGWGQVGRSATATSPPPSPPPRTHSRETSRRRRCVRGFWLAFVFILFYLFLANRRRARRLLPERPRKSVFELYPNCDECLSTAGLTPVFLQFQRNPILWLDTHMASNERDAISWYQKKVMSVFFTDKAHSLPEPPQRVAR